MVKNMLKIDVPWAVILLTMMGLMHCILTWCAHTYTENTNLD